MIKTASLLLLYSCGTSIFKPLGTDERPAAKAQDAIVAMNNGNYESAEATMSALWDADKTDENAKLYAAALLGNSGFVVIDIIKKAVTNMQSSTGKSNSIFSQLTSILPSDTSAGKMAGVYKAVKTLEQAPSASGSSIKFQKCLAAGIYTAASLNSLNAKVTALAATLKELPTKLSVSSSKSCGANSTVIEEVGTSLTNSIAEIGLINTEFKLVTSVLGDCLAADAQSSSTSITSQLDNVISAADKGCSLAEGDSIASIPFPTCMVSYVTQSSGSAVAGDKLIAGCELFINCTAGGCF